MAEIVRNLNDDLKNINQILPHNEINGDFKIPSLAYIYDFIRFRSPDVGARLVKVRAECHMCAVLVTGLGILSVCNFIGIMINPIKTKILLEGILLMSCVAFWCFMKGLEERLMTGMCNYWFILQISSCDQTGEFSNESKTTLEDKE